MALADSDFAANLLPPEGRGVVALRALAERSVAAPGITHVVHAEGCAAALVARALAERSRGPVVYVAADLDAARRAAADLRMLRRGLPLAGLSGEIPGDGPLPLHATDASAYAEVQPDRRIAMERAGTLAHLAAGRPTSFIVATAAALLRRVPPPEVMRAASLRVAPEAELDLGRAVAALSAAGYLRVPVVEDPGCFAVRGGLLDVWPPLAQAPARVELYGDLVVGVRAFDAENQRTLGELTELWVPPAREAVIEPVASERARAVLRSLADAVNYPSSRTRLLVEDVAAGKPFLGSEALLPALYALAPLWDYLPEGAPVVVDDPPAVVVALRDELRRVREGEAARHGTPHFPRSELYASEDELVVELARRTTVCAHRGAVLVEPGSGFEQLEGSPSHAPSLWTRDHADLGRAVKAARSAGGKESALEPLLRRLSVWREAGLAVVVTARGTTQAERVAALLRHRGVQCRLAGAGDAAGTAGELAIVQGALARGVTAPGEGWVLVTEEEIFGQRAHRREGSRRSARSVLEDLRALAPGDHVVHVEHGIGRYLGLERKQLGEASLELLVVEYAGGDKLFLPVYRMNQIQKYAGGEGAPKLDRLGGVSFAKTKAKVRRRVREMADELLRLFAERAALQKAPLGPADDDYAEFEASFPFEETRDQAAAIADVMLDLQAPRVMDRLVCGDVGFGKTEVALRAAFRNAMAGRQVALLCPTTVLAQQHHGTFSSRFRDWPLRIGMLSRFVSRADQERTLRGLKDGTVDVVIGTHRLLSKDVHFKNLGLLVVDEEQRFGVAHKERIKQLKHGVDVLTLSATPIPRTLQLAIGGLRELSLIATPPVDRRAIRTTVARFSEQLVRDAVERELSRGGQVFYVYNRVEGLRERAERLQHIVPRARVVVAHGQMPEAALERTMLEFVRGDHDVLVCTAIIESGLDIPRANTMLVDRADLFGLSQLYQLRGRVGRSAERAWCYLLVPAPSEMSDVARERLDALERFGELGAGFHLATLDMELRGAGDLLGAEQSGFVAGVGFDMFCEMLEEATRELRGETVVHDIEPELTFDVEALIPEAYVPEMAVRLSLYKRLASAADESQVVELATEMEDRFGPPPIEARRYVELMRLKTELRPYRALGCEATARAVTLHLAQDTPLDPEAVGKLVGQKRSPWRLTPDMRLTRRLREGEPAADGLVLADRALAELAGCLRAAAPASRIV